MNVLANVVVRCDRFDQLVTHVLRVRRGEANTQGPVNGGNVSHQVGKIVGPIAVGIHILSKQRYFFEAAADEIPHFIHNTLQRAAPFAAARKRHNAERAELIASAHHRKPCTDAISPQRHDVFVVLNT